MKTFLKAKAFALALAFSVIPHNFYAQSDEVSIIEKFIRENPDDSLVKILRERATSDKYESQGKGISMFDKNKITDTQKKLVFADDVKERIHEKNEKKLDEKLAEAATVILSENKNRDKFFINITNKSACEMLVKIEDKYLNFQEITVFSGKDNFIVLEKGDYNFSSEICGVKYSQKKFIDDDLFIELNVQ